MCDKTFRLNGDILRCHLLPYEPRSKRECGICRRAEENTIGHRFSIEANTWAVEVYCILNKQSVNAHFCCNAFVGRERKPNDRSKVLRKQYFASVAEMREKQEV